MRNAELLAKRAAVRNVLGFWDQQAYGTVRFGSAVVRDRGKWTNLLTYFLPLHRTDQGSFSSSADYGDLKIVSGTLSLPKAKAVISRVLNKGILDLPSVPVSVYEVTSVSPPHRYYTWDNRFPV